MPSKVNIEDYYPVCEYLSKLNYFVLRMGAKVEKRMMKINDKVIDYFFYEKQD